MIRGTQTEAGGSGHEGAWPRPDVMLAVGVVLLVPLTVVGLATYDARTGVSEVWAVGPCLMLPLTSRWRGQRIPRSKDFWLAAAALVATMVTAGVVSGYPLMNMIALAIAAMAQVIVTARVYRALVPIPTWALRSPRQLLAFLGASMVGSIAGVVLGAYPYAWLPDLSFRSAAIWSVRNLVFLFVGSGTMLMLWHWRRVPLLPRSGPWRFTALIAAGVLGTYLPFRFPELPLSWTFLVPALWAGMTLAPICAAWYVLAVAAAAACFGLAPNNSFQYDHEFPPSLAVDLMLVFATLLILLLVLFRDQRARLSARLDEQHAAVQAQAQLLHTAFETMTEGVVIVDRNGRVGLRNRASRTILGRAWPAESPASWATYFGLRTVEGGQPFSDEALLANPGPDGTRAEFSVAAGPDQPPRVVAATARELDGEDEVLLLLHDITAEHARQRELSGFAGTVAHDLKTPLAGLVGWMEAAEDELAVGDAVAGRMALVRARQAGDRMRQLIDDYLAFAVTREGYLRLDEVPLAELVREVTEWSGLAQRTGATRRPTFDVNVPHLVNVDRTLTRQLLANLIGNSLKYTRPDQDPYVSVRSLPDEEPGWIQIEVADRGVGIEPGDEERIFGVFERSDKDAGAFQGTGLGLALCRSIVTKHGGAIHAERNPHGGATVRFTLPAA